MSPDPRSTIVGVLVQKSHYIKSTQVQMKPRIVAATY